jgi:hypothetical protein
MILLWIFLSLFVVACAVSYEELMKSEEEERI